MSNRFYKYAFFSILLIVAVSGWAMFYFKKSQPEPQIVSIPKNTPETKYVYGVYTCSMPVNGHKEVVTYITKLQEIPKCTDDKINNLLVNSEITVNLDMSVVCRVEGEVIKKEPLVFDSYNNALNSWTMASKTSKVVDQ